MKCYFALSPAEIAEHYVNSLGDPSFLPDTASQLVESVRGYLCRNSLATARGRDRNRSSRIPARP